MWAGRPWYGRGWALRIASDAVEEESGGALGDGKQRPVRPNIMKGDAAEPLERRGKERDESVQDRQLPHDVLQVADWDLSVLSKVGSRGRVSLRDLSVLLAVGSGVGFALGRGL